MRLDPIQRDKFLVSGEHVPIEGDWHFQRYYGSLYRAPRLTALCRRVPAARALSNVPGGFTSKESLQSSVVVPI